MIVGRRVGRVEHDLRDAVAVAQVDEQPAAVVAVAVDPAAEGGRLADVVDAKFAAGMSSQHAGPLQQSTGGIIGKLAIVIAPPPTD